MFVKQISVFLSNEKGSLSKVTKLLSAAGIDLIAVSIADTEHYGILRCIVNDTDKGLSVLKESGYTARVTEVLAVYLLDQPGGLATALSYLEAADISVGYLYSFVRSGGKYALAIFQLDNIERGHQVLTENGVKLMDAEQIQKL